MSLLAEDRPRPAPGVVTAEVDGETVVYASGPGRSVTLNATGALLWPWLDGTVSVEELAGDLAEAFDAPPAEALEDLLGFLEHLVLQGFLVADGDATMTEPPASPAPATGNLALPDPPSR